MAKETIQLRRTLPAPPPRIFALWTEPDQVRRWFGGLDTEVLQVDIDLRPGGRYEIHVQTEQGRSVIKGEFLEVKEPSRLVYTWQLVSPEGSPPDTKVEVEFMDRGNQTEVLLRHGPFEQPEVKILHQDGWQACFEGLRSLI